MNKKLMTTLTLSSAMAISAAATAADNPFAAKSLKSGYQLAEAKSGEGACGNKAEKTEEGKCGEGKCGEGKCGGSKDDKSAKDAEGKCGEGACGERKDGEGVCGNHG